jgi:hypothetical protein
MSDSTPRDDRAERPYTRRNWFVRSLLIGVALLLVSMIVYAFFVVEPRGEISAGLITLVVLLIVVVLSEAFDNFSIGQLLELSRENRRKDEVIARMREETRLLAAAADRTRLPGPREAPLALTGATAAEAEERDALEGGTLASDELGRVRDGAVRWAQEELGFPRSGVLRNVKLARLEGTAAADESRAAFFDALFPTSPTLSFLRVLPAYLPQALQVLLIESLLELTRSYERQQQVPVRLLVVIGTLAPAGEPDTAGEAVGALHRRFSAAIEAGALDVREYRHTELPTV